ncbi:hypothetical protein DM02DRAFT_717373 [Periconia macrospinosa]|uniref:Utp8 beta-propeller domain-containing protein n=1 Tax=Periconia macrospinosa TaxID=97972 RepID=A0A2V1DVM1_9PLEO|nr:hypothetical protein DM02DRAFT_717373 [Periconia macrospinosa]
MSFHQAIGAPYTLATLPHAIGKSDGRPHAACVCSLSDIKKRKRTEIAVGVDGEGISIYSIQNPHLATSYALPPQTSFLSAPYSIYRKGNSKSSPRRFTYAFIRDSTPGAKAQLVCFTEEIRKDNASDIVKTSYTPSISNHKIVAIDALPVKAGGSQQVASHDVLVVFDNGDTICLSSNLESVRWVANLKNLSPSHESKLKIAHVTLSTAKSATHGLLRNRQDIAALVNPSLDEQSDLLDLAQVICVVYQESNSAPSLGLFHISPRSPDIATSHTSPIKHLNSWSLPFPSTVSLEDVSDLSYTVHANTGALHVLYNGELLSFDLTGTLPKLSSNLNVPGVSTFVRISQDLLFTTSPKVCQIVDTKYTSIQAELPLVAGPPALPKDSRKRKHADPDTAEEDRIAPALISYYADLGLVVGTRDAEIVGFQLEANASRKRIKTEGTRLIDSLGKGIKPVIDDIKSSEHERQKWQDKMAKLDKYASKGKIARFESLIANDLGIELEKGANGPEDAASTADADGVQDESTMVNGNGSTQESTKTEHDSVDELPRKWRIPRSIPEGQRLRYKRYALYALSRIFRWVDSSSSEGLQGTLGVDFFPPNVFQWILQSGYLTKESIRRAMLDDPTSSLSLTTPFRDGEIIRAIVDFDPELHILSAILNHGHYLPIGEVVQAIKLLMQSMDDQPATEDITRLLTNGDTSTTNAMDVDIASEMEAASNEIQRAQAMLENGLTVRSSTLRPALIRLHTFPTPLISATLRAMLPRHDLESLIRLLHHEFRNGGWTSPYNFTEAEAPSGNLQSEQADDSAVAIVASLLSSTLDAIGPATWLTAIGGSSEETTEELIFDLLEDTSIALNGFWEATYIRGLVSELLRYASKVPKSKKPGQQALQDKGQPFALDLTPDELPMLPVGAKPDMGVEKARTKGGRKKERSAREMGMLISQRVPKYSFERIVI